MESMVAEIFINLHPQFTETYQRVVLKYLQSPRALSKAEWKEVLTAFDLLALCIVTRKGKRQTFKRFYEEEIDKKYASPFISNLLDMEYVESESAKRAFAVMEQAKKDLEGMGLREPLTMEQRLLLAFCIYWWGSFAKGYITEIAIFRDLEKEGIQFQPHDLLSQEERFSPWDLAVEGMKGDIKSSTYFLQITRSFPLQHDFYITNLFHPRKRQLLRAVIMKELVWNEINGETVPTTLEFSFSVFPGAAEISVRGQKLIVVEYELWKAKIKSLQER